MAAITATFQEKAARISAFGLLAIGILSAGGCRHSSGPEQVDPAAFSWNAPIAAPKTVYIRNTHGSIDVKPATDGNVTVTAETRWRRGNPKREIRFETVNGADGVTICALWTKDVCTPADYQPKLTFKSKLFGSSATDADVTFTVYVPTGVKVDAFTMSGSIGVAATAPVKAESMNGTVKVATAVGPVYAETLNGNVDIRMTTLGADGPVHAESMNGSVSAYLPEKFDGMVKMETATGKITSDFSAVNPKSDDTAFEAMVGAGGRKIELSTVNGSASLHKLKADGTVAAP